MDEYITLSYTVRLHKSELSVIDGGCENYTNIHKDAIWNMLKDNVNHNTYNIGCIDPRRLNHEMDMDIKWTAIKTVTEEYNENYNDIRCPECEKEIDILYTQSITCCVCRIPHFCKDCIKTSRLCHSSDRLKCNGNYNKHYICKICLNIKANELKEECMRDSLEIPRFMEG